MLTQQEKDFLHYWEVNREKEGRFTYRLLHGLPQGIIFGAPIFICFLFRDWYKWLPFVSGEELLVVAIGVFCVVLFYSIFRQQYLWDRKEQQYKEISARAGAPGAQKPSGLNNDNE
ncbi:hypothetical protein [Dinghuibacter silviterrae]|uniref:Uncharacterized protein n=1 Tax=Dinghuibacter silviterrae TaxID=1539049 RepID=A0A4R8DSW1_9BACT|nr:hypothetical protein [Dinghuibacter silviterrae]TDX01169.1 hypothetical protein EDB95_2200 [Dinghuibacter silviterrae]